MSFSIEKNAEKNESVAKKVNPNGYMFPFWEMMAFYGNIG